LLSGLQLKLFVLVSEILTFDNICLQLLLN
jgi:hypothetical protein